MNNNDHYITLRTISLGKMTQPARKIVLKLSFILVSILSGACNNSTKSVENEPASDDPIFYQSTNDSFIKDFFLKVHSDTTVVVYGWEIYTDGDTIYYQSESVLEVDSLGGIRIQLDKFVFSEGRANHFELDTSKMIEQNIFMSMLMYSSFSGEQLKDGTIELSGVKNSYFGRSDEFRFKPIAL